jgi:hypothetical protein
MVLDYYRWYVYGGMRGIEDNAVTVTIKVLMKNTP